MNALILGGSRFIGRALARELLGAGHRLTLYTRGRLDDGLGDRVERLFGDRRSGEDMAAAFPSRQFDAVYDLLSYTASDAALAVKTFAGRTGRFIHVSTCSVYWCTGDFPCPVPEEDFDRLGDFTERPGSIEYDYGYNKRKAEATLFSAHRDLGFPVTSIRLPIVGGAGDPSLRYAGYVARLSDGGPVILPDGGYAPFRHVFVGDVARAMAELPHRPNTIGQAYNLAGAEILSVRRLVASIADMLGRRPATLDVPAAALQRLGLGSEFSPFSQRAAQVPAIGKARRDLDWRPTPWAEWLGTVVREGAAPAVARPPALEWREREVRAAQRWQELLVSLGEESGSSAGRRG